jgi:predicted amidohydrolase YtcJ
MKTPLIATLALLCFAGTAPAAENAAARVEPLLIHNAHGLTLDANGALRRFEALAVDARGRVLATGSFKSLRALAPRARRIDAQGQVLMPGLSDAHGHVLGLGLSRRQLDLRQTADLSAALAAIKAHAAAHPGQSWILGGGWNQANWKLGRFPTAAELDSAESTRPVWLERIDGHAGWANSRALQRAGITRATADPPGGRIEHDAQGEPTGVLIDAATGLVARHVPPPDAAEMQAALDGVQDELVSLGLTSVHDAGVSAEGDALMRQYAAAGRLKLRVYGMLSGSDEALRSRMLAAGPLPDDGTGHYALRAVKLFGDGALGSRGAALLQPYADSHQSQGLLFLSDAELQTRMRAAVAAGFQVNVHAIGDAANRQALAAFEQMRQEFGARSVALRHRIEHAQVIALDDIPRFAASGVIASVQPVHATSDMNMAEDRVGPQRIQGAYAWQRLRQAGARLACGSDFPVEEPTPWEGLYAAITRQDAAGRPPGGWYGAQALTRLQALDCFTRGAAYAAHAERDLGTLERGKRADFILVNVDPITAKPVELLKARVSQTWVGGRLVYQAAK